MLPLSPGQHCGASVPEDRWLRRDKNLNCFHAPLTFVNSHSQPKNGATKYIQVPFSDNYQYSRASIIFFSLGSYKDVQCYWMILFSTHFINTNFFYHALTLVYFYLPIHLVMIQWCTLKVTLTYRTFLSQINRVLSLQLFVFKMFSDFLLPSFSILALR